jgi:hypothetical protein
MQLFVNETHSVKLEADIDFNVKKIFPLLQTPLFNKLIGHAQPEAYHLFEKLNALVNRNAHYSYTSSSGDACLLGETYVEKKDTEYAPLALDRFPLSDVWREFYRREIVDFPTLLQMLFVLSTHWGEKQSYKVYEFMNKEFLPEIRKFYGFDLHGLKKALTKLPHLNIVSAIIRLLGEEYWDATYANSTSENILASFYPLLDKGNARKEFVYETYTKKELRTVFMFQHSSIYYWMSDMFGNKQSENEFTKYFLLRYQFYRKSDYLTTHPPVALVKSPLSVFDFAHASILRLIPEEEMQQELLVRVNAEESLSLASAFLFNTLKPWQRSRLKAHGEIDFTPLKELVKNISTYILNVELQRGDNVTAVSHLAMKLERIEGTHIWIDILKAFDKESFGRTDCYYNSSYTRKEVLSKLLRICYPSATDTAETLARLVKHTDISHEDLMEAALYAPQWLEIVETYIEWKGLQNTAFFLHAHVNEQCDERMKALIARFTSISQKDLCMGAFDIDWFREVYLEIGAKRFDKVFDATKPIASGSEYTRLSRYLEAVNGKIDAKEVRKQVEEKRNRDLLMIYGLIPLNKRSNKDLIERYRYFQQFLKESKSFGSQRQENEKKAVEQGLLNLARNAGYPDVTRLIWNIETLTFRLVKPYFAPKEKEGVNVYLKVDKAGRPGIHYFKAGKELVNIPGKLRKDPYVICLREVYKRLKSIYAHSGNMLEQMMEEHTPFLISELSAFRKNPLIWPLLKHLVFVAREETMGFYTDEGLLTTEGKVFPQEPATEVRIAHPADFYRRQTEQVYRTCLHDKGIEQPFEQVFRKRYDKTEEEKDTNCSFRYAGKRIRFSQMAATLKTRRWISISDGKWQKVYYKENIAAILETHSHALSPVDMGMSTMERVVFYERKNNSAQLISNIPDGIFSEVMRDLDSLSGNTSE